MESINGLHAGMFQDNDPALQPENTYFHGLNGNLISKGPNHFSFESIDGTKLSWEMPRHVTDGSRFIPIGAFRLGDRLVIHSTDDKTTNGGDGEVGIVTFDNSGKGLYSAKYYHADLKYTQAKMMEGYALEENDAYHRNYYTDNKNQGRTINLAAGILNTEYLTGDLIVGQKYMVLTDSIGFITHAATDYGPKQAAGNVFTASGTAFTTTGSAKIIRYLNPNILNYTPEKALSTIDFQQYISGALYCGVKMYAYRLSTLDGYQSSWSFTTNPIHVGPNSPPLGYQAYQGGGSSGLQNSGKGIELVITDIPLEFDKIQVAVIEVDGSFDVIRNSEIFWDTAISGTTMVITHKGQENLAPFLADDLILKEAIIARFKTMTTTKQRQMIGNITERQEITFDASAATITPFQYEIPVDSKGLVDTDLSFVTGYCPAAGVPSGQIFPGAHYVVRGGTSVEYPVASTNIYLPGETFVGIAGSTTFTSTGGSIVRGCIRIQKYLTFAGNPIYKIIDLLDEFFDYKSMASHMYLKGHFRDETYRLAALPVDKFGNPFFGRPLGDVTIPSQSDASGDYKLLNNYSDTEFTLNAIGLEISNLDITDIKDQIGGIMIVRVPRDKTVLGQGILWSIMQRYDASGTLDPNVLVPCSNANPQNDYHGLEYFADFGNGYSGSYRFGLLGPEFDFNLSAFNITLQSGDQLKAVADLDPLDDGGVVMEPVGLAEQLYSKYYKHNRFTGGAGSAAATNIENATFSGVYATTGLPGGYTLKNHDIATYMGVDVKAAGGGPRTIFTVNQADWFNGSNSDKSTGTVAPTTNRRLLVNYMRPKQNQYGGTSDVAKANNLYIPTGHFLKIDATVLADIDDGAGNYVLNGMQVWGGDCFVNLYDRVTSLFDERYDTEFTAQGSYSWGIIFPVESDINVGLREGRHFCRDGMHNNTGGVVYNYSGSRRDENFTYNPAYSSENDQRKYASLPVDFRDTGRFPYMSRYSQQKTLGETIDNMRIFLVNNFKNADALHGEINNLIIGLDRLFYLQNKGVGYFPVEERETTTGVLGQAVQLGIGGVMQRADTMDSFYGNQHQWGLIRLENSFTWFDMRRRTPLRMSYNGQVMDFGVIKGMQSFFQNAFADIEEEDVFGGNILALDQPLLGRGIIGAYDTKHKTAYLSFKYDKLESRGIEDFHRIMDFTIGISSQLDKFTGFFSFAPGFYVEHNNELYGAMESRYNIIAGMEYIPGMIVSKDGSNYLCIQALTTGDPVAANMEPDYPSSAYWVKVNSENEVWQFWKGDICKLFGVVYPYKLTVIQNQDNQDEKTYDNVEIYGNNAPFTDLIYSTSRQTGSDLDIQSRNKNIRYIDNSWWANVPFDQRRARLLDHWMKIEMSFRNFSTDQTVSLNQKKRIVYLRTIYRKTL